METDKEGLIQVQMSVIRKFIRHNYHQTLLNWTEFIICYILETWKGWTKYFSDHKNYHETSKLPYYVLKLLGT